MINVAVESRSQRRHGFGARVVSAMDCGGGSGRVHPPFTESTINNGQAGASCSRSEPGAGPWAGCPTCRWTQTQRGPGAMSHGRGTIRTRARAVSGGGRTPASTLRLPGRGWLACRRKESRAGWFAWNGCFLPGGSARRNRPVRPAPGRSCELRRACPPYGMQTAGCSNSSAAISTLRSLEGRNSNPMLLQAVRLIRCQSGEWPPHPKELSCGVCV